MKLNKTIGRVATTLVATAMLASLAAPAYAAGGVTAGTEAEPVTSVTITKKVETDVNTYAPKATFTFDVEEGTGKTFNDGTGTVTAEAGIEGGLVAGTGSGAVFAPVTVDDEEEVVAPAGSYTANGTLTVDADVFTVPGIYHYVVTENDLLNEAAYEGITKDSSTYDVYLYVYNNSTYTDLYVGHVVTVKNGDTDAKADLEFTNVYTTGSVTVTKYVEGSFANKNDTFSFNVSVSGASGEAYKVVYTNGGDVQPATVVTSGNTITVNGIGDEDTITIYGLSANDTYTVTEKDAQGYNVTDTVGDNDGEVSGTISTAPTASITNTKDASAPTGIVMNVAPYALLVVIAAAGCFVFLRKRRED